MATNIAITGEGIVCCLGASKETVAEALKAKRTGIGAMRHLHSSHNELLVGEVSLSDDEMKQRLGLPHEKEVSRTSLLAMTAVSEALEQARIGAAGAKRVVLISGTTVGGMDVTEQKFGAMAANGVKDDCLDHHDCGSNTADIASHFGIFTDYTTISTACSSAANAIILGAEMLKAGDADIVVAGGSEALTRFHLNGFNSLMILDHDVCRPFDRDRAGLNLGEGAAYVVMEREENAVRRGATPQAYLTGYGNACDAYHQTASSPDGIGAQMAMRQALEMAGLGAADMDWIHAHGTGTPNNDESESHAIQCVFGSDVPPLSSTKGFTGHTTSASGGVSAVISIIAMNGRFIPANYGLHTPMGNGITPTMGQENATLHNVLCNSFGFGGNDSALLFSDTPHCGDNRHYDGGAKVVEAARIENDSVENLTALKKYVSPTKTRRMGKLMKSALLTSLQALEMADIVVPDALVTGTALGCLQDSEEMLKQLEEGEDMTSPTLFMQSTHNTIGSCVAIHLKCHGYNITFTQGGNSLDWALYQARLLLRSGRCKTVLVGCHDESTPLFNSFLRQMGRKELPYVHSIAMVLTLKR